MKKNVQIPKFTSKDEKLYAQGADFMKQFTKNFNDLKQKVNNLQNFFQQQQEKITNNQKKTKERIQNLQKRIPVVQQQPKWKKYLIPTSKLIIFGAITGISIYFAADNFQQDQEMALPKENQIRNAILQIIVATFGGIKVKETIIEIATMIKSDSKKKD